MVTKLPLLICFLLAGFQAFNQIPGEKELVQKFTWATEDEGKIEALGELAELYSIYRDNKKVDSILQKQMLIAEVSQNQKLMLRTTSSKAIDNIATWSSKETFDRAMSFLQKKLDYAKKHDNSKLEAFTYLHLASLLRKRNLYDQAMDQMALAFPLLTSKNDSLKSTFYLELGDTFLGKGDAVSAYKNYNSAYDVAYSIKNIPLQSATWHRFANLYKDFGDTSLSKNALLESLRLNTKNNYAEGRLSDYIDLFRQTDEIEFLKKAMFLADSLHSVRDQLFCKRLMFSFIMVVEKNAEKSLAYLKQNPDLNLYLSNNGLSNYNIGAIYQYGGQYAEAVKYYLLDEPLIMQTFETSVQLSFFREVANCYHELKNVDKAIEYYEKAFNISKTSGNYNTNATITLKLSQLYAQKKRF